MILGVLFFNQQTFLDPVKIINFIILFNKMSATGPALGLKILILGSRGLIGSSLTRHISDRHTVTEWDIAITNDHDLRNPDCVPEMSEFDFVFFLAYDIGGSKYLEKQDSSTEFINNNQLIMINVFRELERSKKPFIFASSQMQNMYGPYGALKRLGEQYTSIIGGLSVRFWNIYGHETVSLKSHVVPDLLDKYTRTGTIDLLTDGTELKQFLHTYDSAKALECCMRNYATFIGRKVVDVTSFEWITVYDLASIIVDVCAGPERSPDSVIMRGSKIDKCPITEPDPFILDYWKPEISLIDGITSIKSYCSI
jgi:nucleoside-diphosphate-sugar epimerase